MPETMHCPANYAPRSLTCGHVKLRYTSFDEAELPVLDREKTINWWIGRFSDQDLAEWTGMAPRAVGLVLNIPSMREGISGGGRGSKTTRRIAPKTRNAVAVVHALAEAGLALELAVNVIVAIPQLASMVTPVIDLKDASKGLRSLPLCDPNGPWLPVDVVPWHIWERFTRPCVDVNLGAFAFGDVLPLDAALFQPNTDRGTMIIDRKSIGLSTIEVKPITSRPVYSGEIDPAGLYEYCNAPTEAVPGLDEHVLIVDGRWIFRRGPDQSPEEALAAASVKQSDKNQHVRVGDDLIAVIEPDRKTVRRIWRSPEEDEAQASGHALQNYRSLLDINLTLAVRIMKRRALGLPVDPVRSASEWIDYIGQMVRVAPDLPASPFNDKDKVKAPGRPAPT